MSTTTKRKLIWGNVAFLSITPALAIGLTPLYAYFHGIGWSEVIAAFTLWWITGLCITAGYHRLWAHRSYKAPAPIRLFFAIFGGAAWQNSVISWAAAHRFHHRDVDTEGDPYNAKRGLLYSHIGWILVEGPRHKQLDNVDDLWKDPICVWQHKHYLLISSVVNVGIPLLLGIWTGNILGMLLFAGLLRVVLVQHFTFTINSLAHKVGRQPWTQGITARDSWLISLVSFGEGYHNYHHAFQTDYRNGTRWFNYDPSKWLIFGMSKVKLARNLKRTPVDTAIRRRFFERREAFARWVEEEARPQALHVSVALKSRLESAQQRLEHSLEELTRARRQWTAAKAEATRREIKALKRSLRQTQRAVKATLCEWEFLAHETIALAEPLPA
jgi:stearoyl-CoA desaturase (delta-9 desaturase)